MDIIPEGKIIDRAMALKEKVESPDWVVPNDEEIPEPVEEDTTEYYTYAAAPLEIKTLDKEEKNKKKEIEKEENQVEDEIKIDPSVLI